METQIINDCHSEKTKANISPNFKIWHMCLWVYTTVKRNALLTFTDLSLGFPSDNLLFLLFLQGNLGLLSLFRGLLFPFLCAFLFCSCPHHASRSYFNRK